MSWKEMEVRDLGKSARFGKNSMEVLFRDEVRSKNGPRLVKGKVSVAELPSGKLIISASTTISNLCNHFELLELDEKISSKWKGGAFYKVDWLAKTVEVYGKSDTMGGLPEDVLPLVQVELQKLLDQFLLSQKA